ncbi:MAG: Txe/YoeB family addiction module toxin [Alphaproteobacteria bacterium]|nr:Txe/YoeB family addiction module toxin [Alphaproteobacteria bacterium]
MNLEFDDNAFEDLRYWVEIDRKKAQKIMALLEEVKRTPFFGTGKPEPLKHKLEKCWSRRIDQEHRLVYLVEDKGIRILSCRYRY